MGKAAARLRAPHVFMKPTDASIEAQTLARVGVFDSGVGGLSVFRELRAQLPRATLHYVADSAHAPYGERSDEHVITRSHRVTSHLIRHGAQIIVIACNTATALAIQALRTTWPTVPMIGVEPGIKPALAASRNGRIGVLATRATLHSEKFRRLATGLVPGMPLYLRACDGLAAGIERGVLDDPQLLELIEHHCEPLRKAEVDTVVLGCTHYTFVRHHIQAALGVSVHIVDTADAVARHAANIARERIPGTVGQPGSISHDILQTTGEDAQLRRIATAWLGREFEATNIVA